MNALFSGIKGAQTPWGPHNEIISLDTFETRHTQCEIIRIDHECEGGIEKSVLRITDWHHKAIGDTQDGFFYPTLTRITDSFSCSPLNTSFYIGKT